MFPPVYDNDCDAWVHSTMHITADVVYEVDARGWFLHSIGPCRQIDGLDDVARFEFVRNVMTTVLAAEFPDRAVRTRADLEVALATRRVFRRVRREALAEALHGLPRDVVDAIDSLSETGDPRLSDAAWTPPRVVIEPDGDTIHADDVTRTFFGGHET